MWILAAAVTLTALVAAEIGFRALGLEPMVQDDPRLWTLWRDRLDAPSDKQRVVLIGTSRMQLGVDPAVVQEQLGPDFEVINLSTNGGSPLPVLRQLANSSFDGTVVCGLHPRAIFGEMPKWERKTQGYLDFHQHKGRLDGLETETRLFFQQQLVIMLPDVMPTNVVAQLLKKRELPSRSYISSRLDRFLGADYTMVDLTDRGPVEFPPDLLLPAPQLTERITSIERAAQAITGRGGKVVFVRMVSSGATVAAEEKLMPRATHYERMKAQLDEARFFHFADDPVLSQFSCPDGGHLDQRDSAEYSRRLGELLRENR